MPDRSINRRTLLKSLAALPGGLAASSLLTGPILRAFAIDPAPGSTFLDAEHVVFLMQENRSFDHSYGTLRGVRGFNDPRAIDLPSGRPVWLQEDAKGQVFAPFRLDMQNSRWTWMGSLPHGWPDQVDARNHGKYDQWLKVKAVREFGDLPMTLGYCTRADIPFYYALADAFTICDQHFCSSLTGTTPNRLYFWTGTIRERQSPESMPLVHNSDAVYDRLANWTTFPERLLEHGVSWKVYQNELTVNSGLSDRQADYLANFGDNPLEYFKQYGVHFAECHVTHLQKLAAELPAKIGRLEASTARNPNDKKLASQLVHARQQLERTNRELATWSPAEFAKLPAAQQAIHRLAFTTNRAFSDYRELATSAAESSSDGSQGFTVPKGDIFRQFREDVNAGKLPTVSWLVAPCEFSDHPTAPWFGAWYVSEALNILTQNPEVWKKTIFVLNYDENDGYFDHAPPFVPPRPGHPETGACSEGVDPALDYTERHRTSPIGLGYRVPLVVASPWSRGGWVNSQVFDLTSPIRFLEQFLHRKRGLAIRETNLSSWRRTVAGDLTSVFRPWNGEALSLPPFLQQEEWMAHIYSAKVQAVPNAGKPLTPEEIEQIARGNRCDRMPRQEPGTRDSCALPYELRADGSLKADRKQLTITFAAGDKRFGAASAGAPFQVYAPGRVAAEPTSDGKQLWEQTRIWNYAVAAGKSLTADWSLANFDGGKYHLRVYGPNGFYRELIGSELDPAITVTADAALNAQGTATDELHIALANANSAQPTRISIQPNAYEHTAVERTIGPGESAQVHLSLRSSYGWYDFTITAAGNDTFARRYAGRIETGQASKSDPVMGRAMS